MDPLADSPTSHEEYARKAETLLGGKGFLVTTAAEADYLVFFGFGTVQTSEGRVGPGFVAKPARDGSRETKPFQRENEDTPDPPPLPDVRGERFQHYFTVVVIDGRVLRETEARRVVWRGEAQLVNPCVKNPKKPRELLDRLFLAAFDDFGKPCDWTRWYDVAEE